MKLARSKDDRKIAGVCGGIARALGVSSEKVRLAFVLLVLFCGLSIITYFILWLLMPEEKN